MPIMNLLGGSSIKPIDDLIPITDSIPAHTKFTQSVIAEIADHFAGNAEELTDAYRHEPSSFLKATVDDMTSRINREASALRIAEDLMEKGPDSPFYISPKPH
jgi:hypothetical protein